MRNKLLLFSVILCLSTCCTAVANLSVNDITSPKTPAYRVGISDIPENPYVQSEDNSDNIKNIIQKQTAHTEYNDIASYSELNIKKISQEISYELESQEQEMISDLSLLWQGAAMQSDTINFALYKLSNPDADKPEKSVVKNMLKTVASMSTLVGAGISNPLLAGSSLIGANVLGIMGQDTKALNYKYSKVTDTDMIILIRKIEDLQQKTVDLYYDYMNAKQQLDLITKLANDRKNRFELAQTNNASREIIVITDSHYRAAIDRQKTVRSEFLSKRAALEQFVGNEAFTQFEQELALREKSQDIEAKEVQENYKKTISVVENYTNNLENKTASLSGVGYIEDDKNLSKLPPIEQTGYYSEVNTEGEGTKSVSESNDSNVINESKNVKKKTVKKDKPKKVKKDPYDTKGFIFLHDNQPDMSNYTETPIPANNVTAKEKRNKLNTKKEKKVKEVSQKLEQIDNNQIKESQDNLNETNFYGVELLPLDEIKVPDLKPNGYSIFAR